jgi:hypothetical protein
VEDFTDTSTLPLSIPPVNPVLYEDPRLSSVRAPELTADMSEVRERLLAAVVISIGEVEAAEWALDQAKATCDLEIAAALASGVPVEKVAAATGLTASALSAFAGNQDQIRPDV